VTGTFAGMHTSIETVAPLQCKLSIGGGSDRRRATARRGCRKALANKKTARRRSLFQHLMQSTLRGVHCGDSDEYHHRNDSESDDHAALSVAV
jgi:hypothetical protein